MVDKCSSPNMSYREIVDAFACIGEASKTGEEANRRVVELNNQLADQFGIDELQVSTFSARVLDYVPKSGSTASQIHQDLVAEMKEVVTSPQTRNPVNDTTPTGIPGIDRLRELSAGVCTKTVEEEFLRNEAGAFITRRQVWPRNEAGEQITMRPSAWPRNEAGAYIREEVVWTNFGKDSQLREVALKLFDRQKLDIDNTEPTPFIKQSAQLAVDK